MAQYYNDFTGLVLGEQLPRWTSRWDATCTWSAQEGGSLGNKVLKQALSGTGQCFHSWDVLGSTADGEGLIRARSVGATTTNGPGIVLRGSTSAKTGYVASLDPVNNRVIVAKIVSGVQTILGYVSVTHTLTDFVWIRLSAVGTAIKARAWKEGTTEPSTWGLEVTDSSVASGYCGIWAYDGSDGEIDYVSFGSTALVRHSTDFRENFIGTTVPSFWTQKWVTSGINFAVEEEGIDRHLLKIASTVDARHGLAKDGLSIKDGEILTCFSVDTFYGAQNDPNVASVVLRGSGAAGVEMGYIFGVGISGKGPTISKYVNGTYTRLSYVTGKNYTAGAKYWMRVRAVGTTLRLKVWAKNTEEPTAWDLSTTDSSITTAGWCGISNTSSVSPARFYSFAASDRFLKACAKDLIWEEFANQNDWVQKLASATWFIDTFGSVSRITYDDVATAGHVLAHKDCIYANEGEVLVRTNLIVSPASSWLGSINLCGRGAVGSQTDFRVGLYNGSLILGRHVGGVYSTLASVTTSHALNESWYIRARVEYGGIFLAKAWKVGTAEPDWMIEYLDSTNWSEGWMGIEGYNADSQWEFASIGLAGRAARSLESRSTDFSEFTVGQQPSGWSFPWSDGSDAVFTVETGGSGKVLRMTIASGDWSALAWDAAGRFGDCEILGRMRFTASDTFGPCLSARIAGTGSLSTDYVMAALNLNTDSTGLYKTWSKDSGASSASNYLSYASTIGVANTWYWARFRLEGTSWKAKMWAGDLADEPASWQQERTVTAVTLPGKVGVHGFDVGVHEWDYISVSPLLLVPEVPEEQPAASTLSGNEANSLSSSDNGSLASSGIYSTDFSEYAHAAGVPVGWTARWNTANITYNVTTDTNFNDDVLVLNASVDGRHLISKDDQDCADGEALILFTQQNYAGWSNPVDPNVTSVVFRGSGAATTENGYALGPRSNGSGLILVKYTNGAYAQILGTSDLALSSSLRYLLRVRWQGTSIKGKIWQEGTQEPSTWNIDTTDASFSASGWTGLRTFEADANCYVYALGMVVGSGTATIPSTGDGSLSGIGSTSNSSTEQGSVYLEGSSVNLSGNESMSTSSTDNGFFYSPAGLLAFPGALGHGAYAVGGRGGTIYRVNTLADNTTAPVAMGDGTYRCSLRAAVNQSGPRIILFEVSGVILLTSKLTITNPYCTIYGQTAPSPGIACFYGGLDVRCDHVIVQHLRFFIGDTDSGITPSNRDGSQVILDGTDKVIVDHCSFFWAIDECVSTWNYVTNITYSNCLIAESLNDSLHTEGSHSTGMLIGDHGKNISVIQNLIIHCKDRHPRIKGDTSSLVVNNAMYNMGGTVWVAIGGVFNAPAGPTYVTLVHNHFKNGPNTQVPNEMAKWEDLVAGSELYRPGNIYPSLIGTGTYFVMTAPVWHETINPMPAADVQAFVVAHVGCRPLERTAHEQRMINDYINGTGIIIDSQTQVGGFPTLAGTSRVLTLPSNPSGDSNGDGYTNLEDWIVQFTVAVEGGSLSISGAESRSTTFCEVATILCPGSIQGTESFSSSGHDAMVWGNRGIIARTHIQPVKISWQGHTEASAYRLEVSPNPNMAGPIISVVTVKTSHECSLDVGGLYYVRVTALSGS